jgi:hypothetical protein
MVTLVLNPKAKEQQEEYRKKILAGMDTGNLIIITATGLWKNISKYLPEYRHKEVYDALFLALMDNCKINWNASNVDSAMCWEDTPQGHDYWATVHGICMHRGIFNDDVEVNHEDD